MGLNFQENLYGLNCVILKNRVYDQGMIMITSMVEVVEQEATIIIRTMIEMAGRIKRIFVLSLKIYRKEVSRGKISKILSEMVDVMWSERLLNQMELPKLFSVVVPTCNVQFER